MLQSSFYNVSGEDQSTADVFTADRRLVSGQRMPPLKLEKVCKFPKSEKTITCFAQSGCYSVTVYERHYVTCKDNSSNKQFERNFNVSVDAVSVGPIPGYVLLVLSKGVKLINFKMINQPFIDINTPNEFTFSTSAVNWIINGNELLVLIGTVVGNLVCLSIKPMSKTIGVKQLFLIKNKVPISSITSATYQGIRYILMSESQNLWVLEWPNNANELILKRKIRTNDKTFIPSFISSYGNYISWITKDELRIYTFEQFFDEIPGSCGITTANVPGINQIYQFLYSKYSIMLMTQYYTLLCDKNTIVGFSNEDCSVAFSYPIVKDQSLINVVLDPSYKGSPNIMYFPTEQYLYKIDFSNERKFEYIPSIKEEKERVIDLLQPSEHVKASELLEVLIEKEEYDRAVEFLTYDLKEKAKIANKKKSLDSQLSQEKMELLCEQFLIFELQIIQACKSGNTDSFNPQIYVDTEGKYDLFEMLTHMIQLRAFSNVSQSINDEKILGIAGDSKTAIRILLDNGNVQKALYKIIEIKPSQNIMSLIMFKYQSQIDSLYDHVTDPKVCQFLISLLPFLEKNLPIDVSFKLLEQELTKRDKYIDMLIWTFTTSEEAEKYDQQLFDLIKNKGGFKFIFNPYSAYQHCFQAKLYRTSAYIAFSVGLFREAALTAKNIDLFTVKHYIRRSPRSIQLDLCRELNVEIEREGDEQAIRMCSKENVVSELALMKTKLKMLKKQSLESVQFLQDLAEWANTENQMDTQCSYCKKLLKGSVGYYFPCGHCLHEKCLIKKSKELLSPDEVKSLVQLISNCKTEKDENDLENRIASDCPICGMRASSSIFTSIVTKEHWPMDLISLRKCSSSE